jgi:F0F1-type ATP synthase assembly protein I
MPFNRPIPDPKQRSKISGGFGALVEAEKAMQIALLLPCAVVIGWLGGAWLDSRLHQSWIALVGIVLGSISGLIGVFRMALAAGADPKTENKDGNGKGNGSSGKIS